MLTSHQAAHRLGVKVETLYAYVSRGLLDRHEGDGRESRFDSHDVERLARRGRPRRASRQAPLDIQIDTQLTSIDDHRIRYRGIDNAWLATHVTFEQAAELLWTGALPPAHRPWEAPPLTDALADACDRNIDRIRLATVLAAAHEPSIRAASANDVVAVGTVLLASIVDALLPIRRRSRVPALRLADGTNARRSVAARLWPAVSPDPPSPEMLAALNAALVLLTDHELAASTFAARVAASTRAGAHAVVLAGLGTLSGPLHGAHSRRVRRLLDRAAAVGADAAIDEVIAQDGRAPGFGQRLYPRGDPRCGVLLDLVAIGAPDVVADAQRVVAVARRRGEPAPNVDFALAVLGHAAHMPADAGEVIFAIARIAGWLAHAAEEYGEEPARFRPRAVYVGVPPVRPNQP